MLLSEQGSEGHPRIERFGAVLFKSEFKPIGTVEAEFSRSGRDDRLNRVRLQERVLEPTFLRFHGDLNEIAVLLMVCCVRHDASEFRLQRPAASHTDEDVHSHPVALCYWVFDSPAECRAVPVSGLESRLTTGLVKTYFVNMTPAFHSSPFPMRLKQARVMRQFSLRELSEKLHGAVSHVALAKYEQGLMRPSSDVLSRLCSVLGQSPDFFFRPERVSIEKVSFRKRKTFGAKETEALLENVRSRLESYQEAEELVGDSAKLAFKLEGPPSACERADIRGIAKSVRKTWGLGDEPIPNLVQLLEDHGIRVIEVDEPSRKFDGCQIEGLNAIAIGLRPDLPVARKRFTIAHELGHVLLNRWIRRFRLPEEDEDKKMNPFASEFLLPAAALRRYFNRSRTTIMIQELVALKLRYGISIEAIVYALKELGMIGQNVYERFYRQVVPKWKAAGYEPGDDKLKDDEIPQRFRRLVLRGVAEGNVSLSRGAGLLGVPVSKLRKEAVPIVE